MRTRHDNVFCHRCLVVCRARRGGQQVWWSVQLLSDRVRQHAQILGTAAQFHILLGDHCVRAPGRGGHTHVDVRRVPRSTDRAMGAHGTGNGSRANESRQYTSAL